MRWLKRMWKKMFREEQPVPPKTSVDPTPSNIDWKHYEVAEGLVGVKEVRGKKHEPKIQAMFKAAIGSVMSDETPWCAAFVNYCLETAGIKGTGKLNARSFVKYGAKALGTYHKGDIVVFWRGSKDSWKGHVGFYAGEDEKNIIVLGGNQSNQVCFKKYPKSRLLAVRRVYHEDVVTTVPVKPKVKGWLDSYDRVIKNGINNYMGNLKAYRANDNYWCAFFRALAASESGLDPFDVYWEKSLGKPRGYDPITGRKYNSEGLLQLSYSDHEYYGCDFDWSTDKDKPDHDPSKTIFDPQKNLECGMMILDKLLRKHGKLIFNRGHYWAVLMPRNKRHKDFLYYWKMYKKLYNVSEDL